ncbi:hypothetical protein D3C78_1034560 [compost metagenome]
MSATGGISARRISTADSRLPWDSITPLGRPVVPPVYMITASASPPVQVSAIGVASAISVSKDSMPAGVSASPAWISSGRRCTPLTMASTSGR